MGRPTDLTPELQKEIVRVLSEGSFLITACGIAGVDYSTVKKWRVRGKTGEEPYAFFRAAIEKAAYDAEHGAVVRALAGGKDATACFRYLERRFRKRWGQRLDESDKAAIAMSVAEQFRSARTKVKPK